MSDVTRIGIAPNDPDDDVISALEVMLKRARAGEVHGLAYAAIGPIEGKQIMWGLIGRGVTGFGGHLRMAGLLAWVQRQVLDDWEAIDPNPVHDDEP